MLKRYRYRFTLDKHGLRDYDVKNVGYVFESSSPDDAIRRVDKVLKDYKQSGKRLSFYAKEFLEAVAISAQTDLYEEEECC
jgi:hypothetical protein